MGIVFLVLIILCILAGIIGGFMIESGTDIKIQQHFSQTKYKSVIERQKMFIESCKENGINKIEDLNSNSNKQRANLIAKQCEFHDVYDIVEFYNNAVEATNAEEKKRIEKETKNKLTAQRNKEKQLLANYTKFSNYVGNEKRIAMLVEIKNNYLTIAEKNRSASKGADLLSNQKEHDWALMGGIASGIAGGAAGLATALDMQADNQRIRQNNAIMRQTVAPLKSTFNSQAYANESKAYEIQQEINKTKLKLVSPLSPEEVFENVSVTAKNVSVSETGAIMVSAQFKAKDKSTNYFDDNSKWVIDGTFIANIYDGENKVGVAELVAPLEGINSSKKLNGICLANDPNKQKYRIEIEPKQIWIMEE